jgi:hypothetical protein
MRFSRVYEKAQDYKLVPQTYKSGFSVEDLPSNYFGALLTAEVEYPGTGIRAALLRGLDDQQVVPTT